MHTTFTNCRINPLARRPLCLRTTIDGMNDKDATLACIKTKIVKDQSRPSCFQLNRFTGHMLPGLFSTAATKTNAFVAACQWTEADKAVLPSWIGLPYQSLATRGGSLPR